MRYLLFLALAVMLAVPVYAAETAAPALPGGGFQGPGGTVSTDTVAKALVAPNKTPVVLTGHVVERLAGSDDKYLFKDATGQIIVDIDHEIFAGRTVTPQTKVRLSGKVDKDMMEPVKIDVKVLEILK